MKGRTTLAALAFIVSSAFAQEMPKLRPPAVPLVTFDPYLSIWSGADALTGDVTRHWTRRPHPLVSLIRIDGKAQRLMGVDPRGVPAMPQQNVTVWPTRSVYEFDDAHVHVTMTFMTPALPNDLEMFARPLSYITWDVKSVDGQKHDVQLFDGTSGLLTVNQPKQKVTWEKKRAGDLSVLKIGTVEQTLLTPPGDDVRVDWGYAYTATAAAGSKAAIASSAALAGAFVKDGSLPADDAPMPRAANEDEPALGLTLEVGAVTETTVSRHVIVAYDEIYAIKYFGQKLRPYWRRNGAEAVDMLKDAEKDYATAVEKCTAFDKELTTDLTAAGGSRYAAMGALAYRQCAAACGLAVDANKQPLFFTKENTSNGDIATVDVFYPMDPIWILLSPTLAKASIVPVLTYAKSPRWKFPNAPHDLGTYPVARGTDDGGEGMPVEESGNMLLLIDAIAHADGNADFAAPWWDKLTQWAEYLEKYGLDPENQLCTDDFMGHLAHNANLSVKAILGLAAYGDLCHMRGDEANAKKYHDIAKTDAEHWMKVAAEGDHYRLAFDKPSTWSQKYNLAWDRILGLNIFPPEVAQKEVAYYKSQMQKYGVPLDSRTKLTKTDWSVWSATLADSQADFEALTNPIFDYLNDTSSRSPFVDSYETNNSKSDGMRARPVIGGVYMKMLAEGELWKKWASRDLVKPGPWAEMPKAPKVATVVADARTEPATWKYTTAKPQGEWTKAGFDDKAWREGKSAFGTRGTPNAVINTEWKSADVWLRREIQLPIGDFANLQAIVYHDEDIEVYVDGVLACSEGGFVNSYEPLELSASAREKLKSGAKVLIAVHCHQTEGGQGVDVGFAEVVEAK